MYVPDGIAERRRKEDVSYTAFEIFLLYCEHAAQATGLAFPSLQLFSQRLNIRLDHVKAYDLELQNKGWISITDSEDKRLVRLHAGWTPRDARSPKNAPITSTQTLGNNRPKLGNTPQSLVSSPQTLGTSSQTLGTLYKAEPAPLTSPPNQALSGSGAHHAAGDEAVRICRQLTHRNPNQTQREQIAEKVTNLDKWRETVEQFMLEGQPPQHVDWMLERYVRGPKPRTQAELNRPGKLVI